MPVYLCQPGASASEPWRHGIQVYAAPFAMDEPTTVSISGGQTAMNNQGQATEAARWSSSEMPEQEQSNTNNNTTNTGDGASTTAQPGSTRGINLRTTLNKGGHPIRRIRHAEVLLVDDVCIAFERYWLRLRWPGRKGGFAGYIALGKVNEEPAWAKNSAKEGSVQGTSSV